MAKLNPQQLPTNQQERLRWMLAPLYLVVLAFAFFLLFYNLDGRLFWGDEAETATLARNVTRYGIPKTFDGVNRLTLVGAAIDNNANDVWIWSPWVQQYVAAAAFYVLGPSTWSGRMPFAFIGWLSVAGIAWIAYRVFRDHWIALGSMLLMGTSEVFLLHCRQCRYYSISVFAELLLIYGAYQLLRRKRTGICTVTVGLTLHFYTNYILAAANIPLLLVLGWMLYREQKRAALPVVLSLALAGAAAVPWVLYAHSWRQYDSMSHNNLDRFQKTARYLLEYHLHFVPLVFGLLPAGAWVWRKWLSRRKAVSSAGAVGTSPPAEEASPVDAGSAQTVSRGALLTRFEWLLLIWLPLYAAIIVNAPGLYLRYLLPTLPAGCLLVSVWVFRYIKWRPVGLALILAQCASNVIPMATAFPWKGIHTFRSPLIEYVGGLLHPYHERLADVLEFLRTEAKPGQVLMGFDPEFPLIFYTPLKVIDGRFITVLTDPLPDWILSESASALRDAEPNPLPDFLKPRYEAVVLQVHDSSRTGSMPEPDAHQYRSPERLAPFVIYRKLPNPTGS